ncbi:hypothetical protein [Mycolicibacterium sp. lyk4-40-TYG-92]|uniref:hypothetical protein n=1 Tax=Mycolicibacterium sp. lyk4-40-TYG-92 TaxID=3040295 RepID=UPI00254A1C33|nr:hypothetical protein [Mycolicibacterium sp. lyk4-40-TYG-92]
MSAIDEAPEISTEPVELDPPDPALTRWQQLAARDIEVEHDGDAEKIVPFPRPAWADPDYDRIAGTTTGCWYQSTPVRVASHTGGGTCDDGIFEPAHFKISARVHGNGNRLIGFTMIRRQGGQWEEAGMSMTPADAQELADVLRAAVDIFGEPEQ